MKATGIVRRIDDLGRIVIPKEIRRTLRIREGDPLEIYTDRDGSVIFKKYSPLSGIGDFMIELSESLQKTTNCSVLITDRDSCLAAAGPAKKDVLERSITREVQQVIEERQVYTCLDNSSNPVIISESAPEYVAHTIAPILSEGDILGSVIFADKSEDIASHEPDAKLAQTIALFLGRYMES